ncbi:MAG: bifunctional phosphoribosylaminoimidazolecarboxamide formyltransferase/IMP cyclohydrolase [Armatimonadetes bacterium]|nr:bifunctional phosphoribosylaminoimidazolecarboxamide formyltransferase/IMP cyclohydrolase [Armatimonadota bacterium]
MPRALLSVTDKTGLIPFAQALVQRGFTLVSTGGTAKHLREAGLAVTDVSEVTGFPEIMGGRVKTLHPKVHGGLLGDQRNPEHVAAMAEHGIEGFDVVAVNLYAFAKTVSGEHELDDAIESIDIGGPAMIRASAKNHANVLVVVDPADYDRVIASLDGGDSLHLELAAKAFRHTAYYDSMISRYLTEAAGQHWSQGEVVVMGWSREAEFRYGENPHQSGLCLVDPMAKGGVVQAKQHWGKSLSYNNVADADAAYELVADMPAGSCAIIKHGNPCGAACGADLGDSYRRARASDPISAFGGIAAFNQPIDRAAAEAMTEKGNFLEVVIGPAFSPEALEIFQGRSGWGTDVRLLEATLPPATSYPWIRTLRGGAIAQSSDEDPANEWKVVTDKAPTEEEWLALRLMWAVIPHVKSNAIVIGNQSQLLGVGAGQMNRVQSVRLAIEQAGEHVKGAVLASDAFFPFPDSVETAAAAGISALIQPGGSKKDADVIAKANELGLSMVFTGTRHFRH